jgi:4-hydroxybenzoate polyprenyltransferase
MTTPIIRLLRVRQWTKNLLCLAGVIFSGRLFDLSVAPLALLTMIVFSLGSSSVYILNDIIDRERDRQHPTKRNRPIANGQVSIAAGASLAGVLAIVALIGAWAIGWGPLGCVSLYLANSVVYSLLLKHRGLFDVLSIAFGFVLRLLAGIYLLNELPTAWMTLCVFFLALFLSLVKRRAELRALEGSVALQRPVLKKYTVPYLDSLVNTSATMVILCYALFSTLSGKNSSLILTLPFVYYGVMHYMRVMIIQEIGEEPERLLLTDVRIMVTIFLWLATYFAVLHWNLQLFG